MLPRKADVTVSMYHGGGFTIGGAQSIPFNQVRYLLSKGFVVVSFEYRKLPQSVTFFDFS